MRRASLAILSLGLSWSGAAPAAQPATLRVDYVHSGNALVDHYALDRVVEEALPWPGNLAQSIDTLELGAYFFDVVDPATGRVFFSRGYSSVFGEWRTTEEARGMDRAFGESLRFPKPDRPVRVRVYERDDRNRFSMAWTVDIDPAALEVQRKPMSLPPAAAPVTLRDNGPPERKVDLLILGDGYTEAERPRFLADARRLGDALFGVSPFKERARDFNLHALMVPTPESGVSRPSTGQHRASALGTRYDIFGSERYVLTLDNRALRDIAQHAPYEFIEILVNGETYGGGGIYGQFSTAAAGSEWAPYLMVHEFGHHFAALADEYYTSPVSYAPPADVASPGRPTSLPAPIAPRSMEGAGRGRHAAAHTVAQGRVRDLPARDPGRTQGAARARPPRGGNERAVPSRAGPRRGPVLRRTAPRPRRRLRGRQLRGHRLLPLRDELPDVHPHRAASAACARNPSRP